MVWPNFNPFAEGHYNAALSTSGCSRLPYSSRSSTGSTSLVPLLWKRHWQQEGMAGLPSLSSPLALGWELCFLGWEPVRKTTNKSSVA